MNSQRLCAPHPTSHACPNASCDVINCLPGNPCADLCESRQTRLPTRHQPSLITSDACGTLDFRGMRIPGRVMRARFYPRERYPSILRCGGHWLLSSRVQFFDKDAMREVPHDRGGELVSLMRRLEPNGEAPRISHARLLDIPPIDPQRSGANPLSHNLAAICREADQTLVAVGGRHLRNPRFGDFGIRRSLGPMPSLVSPASTTPASTSSSWMPATWSEPELVNGGGPSTKCIEKRSAFREHGCEFDGKLSLVWHDGALLMYARANFAADHGARHVQVARSEDGGATWLPFQVCEIDGYEITSENNSASTGLDPPTSGSPHPYGPPCLPCLLTQRSADRKRAPQSTTSLCARSRMRQRC